MINHPCGRQVAYFGSSCGWQFRGLTWWSENMMRRAQSMPSSWSGASAAWKVLRGHFLGAGSELETKKEHWPLVSWIIVLWCFIPGGALALRKRFIGLYLYERTSPIISYYHIILLPGLWVVYISRSSWFWGWFDWDDWHGAIACCACYHLGGARTCTSYQQKWRNCSRGCRDSPPLALLGSCCWCTMVTIFPLYYDIYLYII